MPATLVNITSKSPTAVQVWGFHGACTLQDVAQAVNTIGSGLAGDGQEIHIMSGTHGYCSGKAGVGAVATREQKFAEEDRSLAAPLTKDGKKVAMVVHEFNTGALGDAPDRVTTAMSALNSTMRSATAREANKVTFLLAYCCSAGTK